MRALLRRGPEAVPETAIRARFNHDAGSPGPGHGPTDKSGAQVLLERVWLDAPSREHTPDGASERARWSRLHGTSSTVDCTTEMGATASVTH